MRMIYLLCEAMAGPAYAICQPQSSSRRAYSMSPMRMPAMVIFFEVELRYIYVYICICICIYAYIHVYMYIYVKMCI